jgi:hypothetical protein
MDPSTVESHIARAEQHVANGQRRITEQRRLIAELKRDRHDINTAESLLHTLEDTQTLYCAELERLRAEAARLGLDS